ncbi:hypothetical protein CEXT_576121 [Caerostris extrusa]|uniref:Helitron helicase-like domain-containing protein n=1 Tax=Caerostris extrusa TaxID=172846 RepID=A0AAV4R8F2_CAEEX|nr:hypothetical protein CEXT_576121 [Caerostris extrusa]
MAQSPDSRATCSISHILYEVSNSFAFCREATESFRQIALKREYGKFSEDRDLSARFKVTTKHRYIIPVMIFVMSICRNQIKKCLSFISQQYEFFRHLGAYEVAQVKSNNICGHYHAIAYIYYRILQVYDFKNLQET